MKVNEKGFTLIELLAVVLILTLLVLLVWPNISNSVDNKKSDIDNLTLNIIEDATKLYISDNKDDFPKIDGKVYCIAVNQLVNQDYLKNNIEYDGEDISNIKTMKVFYDDGFNYVLVDNIDCTETLVPKSFAEDDWDTIIANVKAGNTSVYEKNLKDNTNNTKEIALTGFTNEEKDANGNNIGTYTVRIANITTPEECNSEGFSQTACGFVIEFVDIITNRGMNSEGTSLGGWRDSKMRQYVNTDILNSFPENLRENILTTFTVSGYEKNATENYKTYDKLYLLSLKEIYGTTLDKDTLDEQTRQLDYYKKIGVTGENYSGAIKNYKGSANKWILRSAHSSYNFYFLYLSLKGACNELQYADYAFGVAPAFRL